MAAFLEDRLDAAAREAVQAHLLTCERCYEIAIESREALDEISASPADGGVPRPIAIVAPRERVDAVAADARPRRRRVPWLPLGGAVLAAAAALVLIVRLQPAWWQGLWRSPAEMRTAALVEAVGEQRFSEARLTGGFKYGPLRSTFRSDQPDVDLSVVAAAAQAQQAATQTPSPENMRLLGVARLALGQYDEAIAVLERAASARPDEAAIHSDLAAALAARGAAFNRTEDWARSLDESERALKVAPTLVEALYNRALALQALSLREQAREAWKQYLAQETDPAWRQDAEQRLEALVPLANRLPSELGPDEPNQDLQRRLLEQNPQVLADWVEQALLIPWSRDVERGNLSNARAALDKADTYARALAVAQNDSTLLEAIEAFGRAEASPVAARAYAQFLEGRRLYQAAEFAASRERFANAADALQAIGSPYAMFARYHLATLPYFAGQLTTAEARLEALASAFDTSRYPVLAGRIARMHGIIAVGRGRYDAALGWYQKAAAYYGRGRDLEGLAATDSATAEALRDLGQREWWDHLGAAAKVAPVLSDSRRHVILLQGAQGALSEGCPAVALNYAREVLHNAQQARSPIMLVEAWQWLFAIHAALGEDAAADEAIRQTGEALNQVTDPGVRERLHAEIAALVVQSLARKDPEAAVQAANASLDLFSKEGRNRRVPALLLWRARALESLGQRELARGDLDAGLYEVERQRGNVREARVRSTYFEDRWNLVEEGVRLRMSSSGTSDEALAFLEGVRTRNLYVDSRGEPAYRPAASSALPASAAIVTYFMLPDRLLIWTERSGSMTRTTVEAGPADIEALVSRIRDAARTHEPFHKVEGSFAALATVLLHPIREQLQGVDRLFVVADGPIGEVPFAGLPWPDGTGLLIDHAAAVLLPSKSGFREKRSQEPSAGLQLVIGAAPEPAVRTLPPLPGARAEARIIAQAYAGARVWSTDRLTVEDFIQQAPNADVIHVAAHAAVNNVLPQLSRVYLTASAASPDGVLTAAQISGLSLKARLVVLSGCQTAAGRPTRSEGVMGLTSAFLAAGAHSVVASLWQVDDARTLELQRRLHEALASNADVSDALRTAQQWARTKAKVDADWTWAGWTAFGNGTAREGDTSHE